MTVCNLFLAARNCAASYYHLIALCVLPQSTFISS